MVDGGRWKGSFGQLPSSALVRLNAATSKGTRHLLRDGVRNGRDFRCSLCGGGRGHRTLGQELAGDLGGEHRSFGVLDEDAQREREKSVRESYQASLEGLRKNLVLLLESKVKEAELTVVSSTFRGLEARTHLRKSLNYV